MSPGQSSVYFTFFFAFLVRKKGRETRKYLDRGMGVWPAGDKRGEKFETGNCRRSVLDSGHNAEPLNGSVVFVCGGILRLRVSALGKLELDIIVCASSQSHQQTFNFFVFFFFFFVFLFILLSCFTLIVFHCLITHWYHDLLWEKCQEFFLHSPARLLQLYTAWCVNPSGSDKISGTVSTQTREWCIVFSDVSPLLINSKDLHVSVQCLGPMFSRAHYTLLSDGFYIQKYVCTYNSRATTPFTLRTWGRRASN